MKKKTIYMILFIIVLLIAGSVIFLLVQKKNDLGKIELVSTSLEHSILLEWKNIDGIDDYTLIANTSSFDVDSVISSLTKKELPNDYQVEEVKDTRYEMTSLPFDTEYYVAVVAKKNGTYYKIMDTQMVKTKDYDFSFTSHMKATDITDCTATLSWDKLVLDAMNVDESDITVTYELQWKKDGGQEYEILESDIIDSTYEVKGLTSSSKYEFIMKAIVSIDGKEKEILDENAFTLFTKIPKVTNVKAVAKSTSEIAISWDAIKDGEVTYSLYGASSKNGEYQALVQDIKENKYTEKNVKANTTRYYYVVASAKKEDMMFEGMKSDIASATSKKVVTSTSPSTGGNTSSNNNGCSSSSVLTHRGYSASDKDACEKDKKATVIVNQIASSIQAKGYATDLEKVEAAAEAVSHYYVRENHVESGLDYRTPYGVFVVRSASCAGCTRALIQVLEALGYTNLTHANANSWTHQWVIVTMDGQVGYADGQVGWVGYGKHPVDRS